MSAPSFEWLLTAFGVAALVIMSASLVVYVYARRTNSEATRRGTLRVMALCFWLVYFNLGVVNFIERDYRMLALLFALLLVRFVVVAAFANSAERVYQMLRYLHFLIVSPAFYDVLAVLSAVVAGVSFAFDNYPLGAFCVLLIFYFFGQGAREREERRTSVVRRETSSRREREIEDYFEGRSSVPPRELR